MTRNPDPAERVGSAALPRAGWNLWTALRGAAILGLLIGLGGYFLAERLVFREGVLGRMLRTAGIPDQGTLVLLLLPSVLLPLHAVWHGSRRALRLRWEPDGLRVRDAAGLYLILWENIAAVDAGPTGALRLRVEDRSAVLATHRGTASQRRALSENPGYDGWDFLFTRGELGVPTETVVAWIEAARTRSRAR